MRFSVHFLLLIGTGTTGVTAPIVGWYRSLEWGAAIAIGMAAAMLVIGAFLGLVVGLGMLIYKGSRKLWPHLRPTRIGQMLVSFNRFMNGEQKTSATAGDDSSS